MSVWKQTHAADVSQYGSADAAWDGPSVDPSSPKISLDTITYNQNSSEAIQDLSVQTTLSGSKSSTFSSSRSQPVSADSPPALSLSDLPAALILEIFSHFEARDLCVVACVSLQFRHLSAESTRWKDFFCQRWIPPMLSVNCPVSAMKSQVQPHCNWRDLYLKKEDRARAIMGRYLMDGLHGHTAGVRCARMVPSTNLAVTAGYDSTVRIWDLTQGLPVAASAPLGSTVRAMAVTHALLAVGSSDAAIRIWRRIPACPHFFDVGASWPVAGAGGGREDRDESGRRGENGRGVRGARKGGGLWVVGMDTTLYGHSGPVSCLALEGGRLYSGSWDMTVKVWEDRQLALCHSFAHSDWVWAVAPRGGKLYSTAGSHLYAWDVECGKLVWVREGVHTGGAKAVEASRNGRFVFTGGEDGVVRMFDERVGGRKGGAVAEWNCHSEAVHSLALEDPWLVASSGDATCSIMDVRQVMLAHGGAGKRRGGRSQGGTGVRSSEGRIEAVVRGVGEAIQRQLAGFGSSVYSVDIGGERIICGGDESVVRVYDFSEALEAEERARANRSVRLEHRVERKREGGRWQPVREPRHQSLSHAHAVERRGGRAEQVGS